MCLQEVRCCCSGWDDSFRIRHCSEELWLSCASVFEDHDGCNVAAAVAVVGSRPHCYQLLIKHELVAFMDELMCPADQLQVVDVNKLICDLCTKKPASSSGTDGPSVHVLRV